MLRAFIILVALAASSNTVFAGDLLQPHSKYSPLEVVEIQLRALQRNDDPVPGTGIAQTWAFAHPNNRAVTGPLERFGQMIASANYRFLLGHVAHTVELVVETKEMALYRVTIVSADGGKYSLQWRVVKVQSGEYAGAWMTIAVSPPQRAGNAV